MEFEQLLEQLKEVNIGRSVNSGESMAANIGNLVVWLLGFAIVVILLNRFFGSGPTMVLRGFKLSPPSSKPDDPVLELLGRRQGLLAFLLTILGLEPAVKLIVTSREVHWHASGLRGDLIRIVPLDRLASLAAGTAKPIALLLASGILFIAGFFSMFWLRNPLAFPVAAVFSGVLIAAYYLQKYFLLEFCPMGAERIAIGFKPNLLEGVGVDLEKVLEAVDQIRALLLQPSAQERPVAKNRFRRDPPIPIAAVLSGESVFEPARSPNEVESEEKDETGPAPPTMSPEERNARRAYADAMKLLRAGKRIAAREGFQQLCAQYPETDVAVKARKQIARLRGPKT